MTFDFSVGLTVHFLHCDSHTTWNFYKMPFQSFMFSSPTLLLLRLHNTTPNTIHSPFHIPPNLIPIRSPLRKLNNLFSSEDAMISIIIRDNGSQLFTSCCACGRGYSITATAVDEVDLR